MSESFYDYEMERLMFVHKAQTYVWNLWINRYLRAGYPVQDAIAKTEAIVKEWTGYTCSITFPSESTENIPF